MIYFNSRYQTWFIIGFAICNIILISSSHLVAYYIQAGKDIPVFDINGIVFIILVAYGVITSGILLYDFFRKRPKRDKNNLVSYALKSLLIIGIVFYDGVVLLDTVPTFFKDMADTGGEFSWLKGIGLSSIPLIIGLWFTRKSFEK